MLLCNLGHWSARKHLDDFSHCDRNFIGVLSAIGVSDLPYRRSYGGHLQRAKHIAFRRRCLTLFDSLITRLCLAPLTRPAIENVDLGMHSWIAPIKYTFFIRVFQLGHRKDYIFPRLRRIAVNATLKTSSKNRC